MRQRQLRAVIHIGGILIRVRSHAEGYIERIGTIIAAGGLHINHAIHAIDLAFQRLANGCFHNFSGSAGEIGGHLHLRRHNIGELRHRDAQQRNQARNRGQDRDDNREARAVNE